MDGYLMSVHLTGVCLRRVLTGVHLMGASLFVSSSAFFFLLLFSYLCLFCFFFSCVMFLLACLLGGTFFLCISLACISLACISWACTSWACISRAERVPHRRAFHGRVPHE